MKTAILLDCGAYSAWNRWNKAQIPPDGESAVVRHYKHREIELADYVRFIEQNRKHLAGYIALDVMPPDRRSPLACEEAAEASFRNFLEMQQAGLNAIPVFHRGERYYWLERILEVVEQNDEGQRWVALSLVGRTDTRTAETWLQEAFAHLRNKDGQLRVKVHGLGITNPDLLLKFEFSSVDSTSWCTNYGNGPIPKRGSNGEADFSLPPMIVDFDKRKHIRHPFAGLNSSDREWVEQYLASKALKPIFLANDIIARRKAWLHYYLGLMKFLRGRTKIIFVTGPGYHGDNRLLNDLGIADRLLSYFDLRNWKDDALSRYAERGILGKPRDNSSVKFGSKDYWIVQRRRRAYYYDGLLNRPDDPEALDDPADYD